MNEVVEAQAAGWSLRDTATVVALGLSVLAFILSVLAYRQRIRFHPQPKLVIEWGESLTPRDGLFFRDASIVNHGDASARDVRVDVEHSLNGDKPWETADVLEPGARMRIDIPVVDGVGWAEGGYGRSYSRTGDKETYRMVTPVVSIRWRQAPFAGKAHSLSERAPHTPNMLAGETA